MLLVFSCSDLRRPWCGNVTVSDASLSGVVLCSFSLNSEVVGSIGRISERSRYQCSHASCRARNHVVHSDPFTDRSTVLFPTAPVPDYDVFVHDLDFPEVPVEVVCSPHWKTCFVAKVMRGDRIAPIEVRGTALGGNYKARAAHNCDMRYLHLGDNLGNELMFEKGRGRQYQLLFACRLLCRLGCVTGCSYSHR